MTWLKIVGCVALGALALMACSSDEETGESTAALCAKACAASDELACPNEPPNCPSTCESTFNQIPTSCSAEGHAFLKCGADKPASDLECDAEGESDLKAGLCGSEEEALLTCLGVPVGTGGSGGDADAGAAGGGGA